MCLFAFCEDVAASGGYWLAASADEIIANRIRYWVCWGSSAGFGFDKAIAKLGVERRFTAGEENDWTVPAGTR